MRRSGSRIRAGAGRRRTEHGQTATTANVWSDFNSIYPGYIVAGNTMINLMERLERSATAALLVPGDGQHLRRRAIRLDRGVSGLRAPQHAHGANFPQPVVTYAENTLVRAEASCRSSARRRTR